MKALLVCGGWEGHQPVEVGRFFAGALAGRGFACDIETGLDVFADAARLGGYDLIFPGWTMGQLTDAQEAGLLAAVRGGTGLGGIHGGMGDAFRGRLDYEWMVGGHFVGHPHVGPYEVCLADRTHEITRGLPERFAYDSEQYYMLVDPAVHVLADAAYLREGVSCRMPVAWVRTWGKGRVFYCAPGHHLEEFTRFPEALELVLRGLLWAARKATA